MKKVKIMKYDWAKEGLHIPNKMHLDACIQGGNVYRNKKKYTRKGKEKFNYRNLEY